MDYFFKERMPQIMSSQPKTKWTTKKIMLYGWIDLVLFTIAIIFAILITNLFVNGHMVTTPWPSELTPMDIQNGDGVVLASYWSFSILLICFLIARFVISILICHAILVEGKSRHANLVWWKKISYYVGIFFGNLIPLVLPIYFIKKDYFALRIKQSEPKVPPKFVSGLCHWLNSSLMVLASNAGLLTLIFGTMFWVETRPYYNFLNAKKFYELSSNHNNILYLYFDRTDSWRVNEEIKKLEEPNKGAFRDFTFYSNSLSLSDTTVTSIPYLSFGYNANILDKEKINKPLKEANFSAIHDDKMKITFPGSCNKLLAEISLRDFYKYSFANFIAFWNYLGYGINNVCNFPYYGSQSPLLFSPNNSQQINNEMRCEFGFKNFSGTNSNELQTYQKRKVHYNNIDDAYVVGNLKKELKFIPTKTGVFSAFYSQQNHWDFAIKTKNNHYRHLYGNNSKNLHRSIRDSLIDLSEFINWFKTNHAEIYNRTMIIINSDHGHCFESETNELSSLKRAAGFAPVFMIKPMNAKPIEDPDQLFHVENNLISTADQLSLIRQLLYPNWANTEERDPLDPKVRFSLEDSEKFTNFACYISRIKDNKDADLWGRTFKVMHPHDWRYTHWRKQIQMSRTRIFSFNKKMNSEKSVFDPQNWSKFSDELNEE